MSFNGNHLLDKHPQDMFVEWPCEVTFKQLVVIDGLGNDAPHELEVAEMVGVTVRWGVDGVCDAVTGRRGKQGIHGVEDFTRYDEVPFS